jgi:pyruvate dehydrogenase E2 component (dihydrolipoamide acetyltransferase)
VAVEVRMPKLGLTMVEGEIVRLMVSSGDVVSRGQPLVQIETDKIVSEVESPVDGVVRQILVNEGDTCSVASLLAVITAPGEAYSPAPAIETPLPARAIRSASATHTVEPAASAPGRHRASPNARRLAKEQGINLDRVAGGSGTGGRIIGSDLKAVPPASAGPVPPKVTPLARRMAAEVGVDLREVSGSGRGGRITRRDVEQVQAASPQPILSIVPLAGVRGVTAARMAESARSTAAVTLTTEADATELASLRGQLIHEVGEDVEGRVSFDAILVKLVSAALRRNLDLNSHLVGREIHVMEEINIAVAVATERGLLAPVVRRADTKGVLQIADELAALVIRARLGKSEPADLQGGTFTITNLGTHDIDAFTPIINPPQCGILGVGRIWPRPVARGDVVVIRKTVWLSLTFDHRIVDGAPAARFLQCVKQFIEEPADKLG